MRAERQMRQSGFRSTLTRAALIALACLILAGLASSCARTAVRSELVYEDSLPSYHRVLDNWTRNARIYDGLETVAIFNATYLSKNFREAYAQEYARSKGYTAEHRDRLIDESLEEHARMNVFNLAVYTHQKDLNDLDRKPSSWNVMLVAADGRTIEPERVRKLTVRPFALREFYPYLNDWTEFYEVTFPRLFGVTGTPVIREGKSEFSLVVTGVLGRAEMTWRFE